MRKNKNLFNGKRFFPDQLNSKFAGSGIQSQSGISQN
jgi:hypothetical protein